MKPRLYELTGMKSRASQKPDNYWPLPDTFMGLELEIEGIKDRKIKAFRTSELWEIVKDDSLRGGEEWVFANPLLGAPLKEAIDWFFDNVTGYKVSSRTSTHIHINMMDEDGDADALRNTLGLYICAEELFFSEAGEERRWSGYCAPLSEAPVDLLTAMVRVPMDADRLQHALNMKRNRADRYYALNLMSLQKHGTLEFRHFQCATSVEQVERWIRMIMWLKLGGMRMSADDVDIFDAIDSPHAAVDILSKYIPDMYEEVIQHCPPEKISSKIAAIHTYATENKENVFYDSTTPGLFADWIEKKGVKQYEDTDEDAKLVLEQKMASVKAMRDDPEAERKRMRDLKRYIDHNKNQRKNGHDGEFIRRSMRYCNGVDMLPRDEQIHQERIFPRQVAQDTEYNKKFYQIMNAHEDVANNDPRVPAPDPWYKAQVVERQAVHVGVLVRDVPEQQAQILKPKAFQGKPPEDAVFDEYIKQRLKDIEKQHVALKIKNPLF